LRQVPRHAPEKLSRLIIKYLIFVRTVEEIFSKALWGDAAYEVLHHELFYLPRGRSCSGTDHLSMALEKFLGKHLGAPLGVADYRHLSIAIGRDLLGIVDEDTDLTTGMDAASGRTTATSQRIYGIPTNQVGMLSTQQIAFHLTIDDLWQTGLLQLPAHTNLGRSWGRMMGKPVHDGQSGSHFFSQAMTQSLMYEMKNQLIQCIRTEFVHIRDALQLQSE